MNNMQLTERVGKVVDYLANMQVFEETDPLGAGRRGYENMANQFSGSREPIRIIEEFSIPFGEQQIPVRIYRPNGITKAKSPAILYAHGGWFISGGFETHDAIARKMASATGAILVLIDYRLAPEFPYPAGPDDCWAVSQWVFKHAESLGIDAGKIGVVGDSAGGALASSLARQFVNQIRFQVLIYPATNNELDTSSWQKYADGPILNKSGGKQAWSWYLSGITKIEYTKAVPLKALNFKDIAPTFIILAEHDPLHDEGERLAARMKADGVTVRLTTYKDMVHGFMHMGGVLKETQMVIDEIAVFIKNILTSLKNLK